METKEIKRHDFGKAKNEIKILSENVSADLEITPIQETNWIGFDCDVTAKEFNKQMREIQIKFISINSRQIKLTKGFEEVYKALEILDKDYIDGILLSIKATNEATKSIKKNQEWLERESAIQGATIEKLKKLKAQFDNVDKIWIDCQKWHQEMSALSEAIADATRRSAENAKKIKVIEAIPHLHDVDAMWRQVGNQQISLQGLGSTSSEHTEKLIELAQKDETILKIIEVTNAEIKQLNEYKRRLSQMQHLEDVDGIWDTVEVLKNKVKYAYWVAGGGLVIAIVALRMIVTKVG